MTSIHQGYLVVLKSSLPYEKHIRYKGIDRTPPFSLESYEAGFNDPYLFGKYLTPVGLIPTFSFAQEALQAYSQIKDVDNLEIIYVQTCDEFAPKTIEASGSRFLGFDAAGERPFWSIVNDSPPPDDPIYQPHLSQLNDQGLFSSWQIAKNYLETYLRNHPRKNNTGLHIWEVYSVQYDITENQQTSLNSQDLA